ncbi:Ppx/GppA phosphatase family protein [Billgrantia kenyensis]|uniref:Ppx/GppA family phosphatase n=1 Tax=Billgrantia kenyensis TaxID=321266 RepID=A0A7W0ACA8_9GAMM|nr:Ppx/GppA phosphatase family protein [Halomonas kenyensis]MBA2777788.1 Ppx/GppA family phosphatase [Halomonas kenyensis]MCG6661259.1 Ppx/GppA family phosphatase [Halomonas kenyensis]
MITSTHDEPRRLAAIDLGSNSFHLLVANYQHERFQVTTKFGEKVQLAAGLDGDLRLSDAAMQRAMECLARFAPFVADIDPRHLRIVGTHALRMASNGQALLARAEALLGHEVEIVSGREEARLIYLGVAHSLADVHGRRFILDIGGGSTEFIIGERFEPQALESLEMGCVSYTRRFFAEGKIDERRFRQAETAALYEMESIRQPFLQLGWSDPVGTSGTIRNVAAILSAEEMSDGIIRRDALFRLRQQLIDYGHLDQLAVVGLKPDRARVFPAGVAVLCAVFEAFELPFLRYSDGALREGILYDLIGRNTPEDSRLKTLDGLDLRYVTDRRQAGNVVASAMAAFDQVAEAWQLGDEQRQLLAWAARLHEIGLAVSHSQFHRHGAYLLEHSDLPGFSRTEQRGLAFLVRAHRRKFPIKELKELPATVRQRYARLARLLRLAAILNHSRPEAPPDGVTLGVEGDVLRVRLTGDLPGDALLFGAFEQERNYQLAAGYQLDVIKKAR